MSYRLRLSPSGPFVGSPPLEVGASMPGVVLRAWGVSTEGSGNQGTISAVAAAVISKAASPALRPDFYFDVSASLWAVDTGTANVQLDIEVNGTTWIPIPQFNDAHAAVGAAVEARAAAEGVTIEMHRRVNPNLDLGVGLTSTITGFRLTAQSDTVGGIGYTLSSVYLRVEQYSAES